MKRKILILFLISLLSLTFAACNNIGEEKTGIPIKDMFKRTVYIPENVETIAVFGDVEALDTIVEALGAGSKICNDLPLENQATTNEPYHHIFAPQIWGMPEVEGENGEILIEKVLQLNPDICITTDKNIADTLEKHGLTVIGFSWKTMEDIPVAVNLLGEIFGLEERAEEFLSYFDDKLTYAENLIKDIPEESRKKVLYGNISSFTQQHIIAEWWIPQAGGISVTANNRKKDAFTYTEEDILAWNPEIMLVNSEAAKKEILTNSKLSNIAAVQTEDIYIVPTVGYNWGNLTIEQPLTILWTINKLYPEILTDDLLREEIANFYRHFFNTDLTNEQLTEIIAR